LSIGEPVSRGVFVGSSLNARWLAGTALDVGGPCVETFGMNRCEEPPADEARR
jgi:hypothetical protein